MHECTQCDYKTIKKQHLTKHVSKHAGVAFKLNVCEHCNASFKSKEILDSHILRNHPDLCNYCDLSCNSKQLLDDHVIRKHPEFISTVTTEIYECPYCPYKTTMFGYLKKHTPIHVSDQMSSRKDCCATYSFPNKLHNLSE
nr:unnamed protein product [Callosobruchus analis]